MKKLNWGCGSIQPKGWMNLDNDRDFNADYVTTENFSDDEIDIIVAHCALQTNEWNEIPKLLKEFLRILKPGGILRISLPDIEEGFAQYTLRNIHWFPNAEENIDVRFSAWLTWYSTTKTLLTPKALARLLYEAGFITVLKSPFKYTDLNSPESIELDTREDECYFIEARK